MNKTQMPRQSKNKKAKRLQSSQIPTRLSPFPIVPDQIHKVPQNVRKALKVGKYRRNSNKLPNPQQTDYQFYSDNIEQKDRMKMDVHVKPIFQLFSKKSSQAQIKQQKIDIQEQQMFQQYMKEGRKLRPNVDRNLYIKKKLTPLKKGLAAQTSQIPKRQKRNLKITFLNIQKLQLVKMYENMNQNNNNNNRNNFGSIKKNPAMTSSLITKNNNHNDFLVQNFLQSTTFTSKINSNFRKNLSQKDSNKKIKPFVPPFQRYLYLDFLWKIAFDNGHLFLCPQSYNQKFKIFIGKGNNSLLIKSLFKRRNNWWCFTDRYDDANFIWTQVKINQIFNIQQNNNPVYRQIEQDEQEQILNTLNRQNLTYQSHRKIMNDQNILLWDEYFTKYRKVQDKLTENMQKRNKVFKMLKQLKKINKQKLIIHNHLPNNYVLGNKKALFYTMSKYYQKTNQNVFNYLPLTFHIQNGLQDNEYLKFLNHFYDRAKKIRAKQKAKKNGTVIQQKDIQLTKSTRNMWIVKPGQFTNRGNGITVCMNLQQIKKILKRRQRHSNGNLKTYIIQSYLQRPFLYQKRKFDIRHFILITSIDGRIKGYWSQYGYIRTTSFQYSVNNTITSVHLTNDAVQKYLPQYGKFQKGNKITYQDFQKYLDKQYNGRYNFFKRIIPLLKKIATDSIKASSLTIDPQRKGHNFQIFGLDYMIDSDFNPWLIQINNNPCLQLSCPLLNRIIPTMVQSAIRLCIDPLIPPPQKISQKNPKFNDNAFQSNKFQLVHDSFYQEQQLDRLYNGQYVLQLDYKQLQKQQDQVFEDDGIQLDDD